MELLNKQKIASLGEEIRPENVPVLLGIFLNELETYLGVLSDATYNDKITYLKEISHALKSSAASFGADVLCDFALNLDGRAKQNDVFDEVNDVLAMIDVLHQTQHAYQRWQIEAF